MNYKDLKDFNGWNEIGNGVPYNGCRVVLKFKKNCKNVKDYEIAKTTSDGFVDIINGMYYDDNDIESWCSGDYEDIFMTDTIYILISETLKSYFEN